MARSRGVTRARLPQRRGRAWEEAVGRNGVQTPISATGSVIATSVVAALSDGLTIARIRGRLDMWLSAADAVSSGFSGAVGIGVVSSAAATAGAASVPTPLTEQAWDGWMWWQSFGLFAPIAALSSSTPLDGSQLHVEIDTKAMRKIAIDESLVAVIEVVEVTTAVLQWRIDSRMLVLLP